MCANALSAADPTSRAVSRRGSFRFVLAGVPSCVCMSGLAIVLAKNTSANKLCHSTSGSGGRGPTRGCRRDGEASASRRQKPTPLSRLQMPLPNDGLAPSYRTRPRSWLRRSWTDQPSVNSRTSTALRPRPFVIERWVVDRPRSRAWACRPPWRAEAFLEIVDCARKRAVGIGVREGDGVALSIADESERAAIVLDHAELGHMLRRLSAETRDASHVYEAGRAAERGLADEHSCR